MQSRWICLLAMIVSITPSLADDPLPPVSEKARKVHDAGLLIDGHNDLPWRLRKDGDVTFTTLDIGKRLSTGQTDIPRLREGGVKAQFWSVYIPSEQKDPARTVTEQIDLVHRMIERYPDTFELALSADDIERIAKKGKIACLIGMEGGVAIENDLAQLRSFARLGARYMTLTHNTTLDWADAATDTPKHDGLTPFGERVVKEMNRLGMLVDLSHVSPATMEDAIRVSQGPIIFSHSSALAKCPHPRNVPDEILKQMPKNGGVVMVNFYSGFIVKEAAEKVMAARKELKEKYPKPEEFSKALEAWYKTYKMPRGTVADVADHIDHIKKIAGIDHIGIGGDFDGVTSVPIGLEDVSCYPRLTEELLKRGYSEEDIHKILGVNLLRAFRKAGEVGERLRKTTKPEVDQPKPEPEAGLSPIDPKALKALRDKAEQTHSDALLVIRDGKVVIEEYFGKPKGPIYLASAGKSLTALAIGKLIDQGKIRSLDQPICELFPEWKQGRKRLITVRHLLNHTSGLQNEPNASLELEPPPFGRVPSLVKLGLAAELTTAPGETFAYNNKGYALLAGVIEQASGKRMDVFFGEEFFEPMGIKDFGWIRDGKSTPSGHGAVPADGDRLRQVRPHDARRRHVRRQANCLSGLGRGIRQAGPAISAG